jgi:hypothetical protein
MSGWPDMRRAGSRGWRSGGTGRRAAHELCPQVQEWREEMVRLLALAQMGHGHRRCREDNGGGKFRASLPANCSSCIFA